MELNQIHRATTAGIRIAILLARVLMKDLKEWIQEKGKII